MCKSEKLIIKKKKIKKTTASLDRSNDRDLEGIRQIEKLKDMEDLDRRRTLIKAKNTLRAYEVK